MTRHVRAVFWTAAYLVLVAAPVFLVADAAVPSGLFWVEFSVALGFASLGMLGMQFLLTARVRRAAAPFGTAILYYFHRYLGYLVLAVLVLHAGILVAQDPALLSGLVPPDLSRPLVVGTAALFAGADTVVGSGPEQRIARGRELFRSVGCDRCHSAEGVGRDRYPLDGVGGRLSTETLRAWIVDPRSVDPAVRKPVYDHLPQEEVDALVEYLASLMASRNG